MILSCRCQRVTYARHGIFISCSKPLHSHKAHSATAVSNLLLPHSGGIAIRPVCWLVSSIVRPPSWKIQMAISPRRIIRFTPCLVLGCGFAVGRSNGANSGVTTFNRYVGENNARGVIRFGHNLKYFLLFLMP